MYDLSNSLHDLDKILSRFQRSRQDLEKSELSEPLKLKARQEVYDEIRHAFTLAVAANAAYLREIERLEANWVYANNKSNAFEKQCRFYATYAYDQHLNEQDLKAEISKNILLSSQLAQSQSQLRQAQQTILSLERCRSLRSSTKQSC